MSSATHRQRTISTPASPATTATTSRTHRSQPKLTYAAMGLTLYQPLQVPDRALLLGSRGRTSANVPGFEDLIGPTVLGVPLGMCNSEGGGPPTRDDFFTQVHGHLLALAPHGHAGSKGAALPHPDVGPACVSASQVTVHLSDPYAEGAAGGTGLPRGAAKCPSWSSLRLAGRPGRRSRLNCSLFPAVGASSRA